MSEGRAVVDAHTSEAAWQRIVEECAAANGWLWHHTPDSRRSNPGYPDLVMAHPARREVIWVELKTERGRLRPEQVVWRDALIASGARWYLWRPSQFAEVAAVLGGTGKGGASDGGETADADTGDDGDDA